MKFPRKIIVNGRLADPRKPVLSAFDRGFLYGDGVYETLRAYKGQIFLFNEHFKRLRRSAQGIGLGLPFTAKSLHAAMLKALKANLLQEAVIRLSLSRGPGPLGFDPRPAGPPTWTVIATPPRHNLARLARRFTLALVKTRRAPQEVLDPAFKTTNNIHQILAKREAIRLGADEAVMLNVKNQLTEGTISNVFFVKQGVLHTPALSCGLLPGVTRALVLRLAKILNIRVREGVYKADDLRRADEIFITSSALEVIPAAILKEVGRPPLRLSEKPITEKLQIAYSLELSKPDVMWPQNAAT